MSREPRKITEQLSITRHHLPHWQFGGSTYFITFRSKRGALPESALKLVTQHCLFDHGNRMDLHFGVIMPDHVHLVLQPCELATKQWHDLSKILQGIKGSSARAINECLQTSGAVWQPENFDRIVRDEAEYMEKLNYMLWNPVKAGLVDDPKSYPYFLNPMGVISGI